jgi:hypothetical protein
VFNRKEGLINIYLLAALTTKWIKPKLPYLPKTAVAKNPMTTFDTSDGLPAATLNDTIRQITPTDGLEPSRAG